MKLKTLAEENNYTCYWCKNVFRLSELSKDHIITKTSIRRKRRKKSGRCVLACKTCNNARGSLPFFMFKNINNN